MVQKSFGRRSSSGEAAVPAAPGSDAGSTTGRSVAILAGVTGLVVITALGLALAFNAVANTATDTDTEATARAEVVTQDPLIQEAQCRGQSGCTNTYEVKLTCGSSEEPKSVSVHARDAEAAQAKAERYNRDCRARGASFLAVLMNSGARNGVGASRSAEAAPRVADNSAGSRRSRLRFRRR